MLDPSTTPTPAQVNELTRWTAQGGTLIVVPGAADAWLEPFEIQSLSNGSPGGSVHVTQPLAAPDSHHAGDRPARLAAIRKPCLGHAGRGGPAASGHRDSLLRRRTGLPDRFDRAAEQSGAARSCLGRVRAAPARRRAGRQSDQTRRVPPRSDRVRLVLGPAGGGALGLGHPARRAHLLQLPGAERAALRSGVAVPDRASQALTRGIRHNARRAVGGQ